MNNVKRIAFIFALLITVAFGLFFPKMYSKWQDKKVIGVQKSVGSQQTHLSYKAKLTSIEKMVMLQKAADNSPNVNVVGDSRSSFDVSVNNVIRYMNNQFSKLYVNDLFPNMPDFDFEKDLISAQYVFLFSNKNSSINETFGFWVIHCSDRKNYDFTVCMDGEDYYIYGAKLYSKATTKCLGRVVGDGEVTILSYVEDSIANYYNFDLDHLDITGYSYSQDEDGEEILDTSDGDAGLTITGGDESIYISFNYCNVTRDKKTLVKRDGLLFGVEPIWSVIDKIKK